jgi:hypothetical protein
MSLPGEKAARILTAVLDGAIVEYAPGNRGADLLVRSRSGQPAVPLEVKWVSQASPEQLRQVAEGVSDPWPPELVIVADRFSSGAIEWLREREANWADSSGRARILGPQGLIVIRDSARWPGAPSSFSWSPSALSIAETMLVWPDPSLRIADLAERSGWSPARVAKVLTYFDHKGWTEKRGGERGRGSGRAFVDPDGLLEEWAPAAAGAPRRERRAHRATHDVMALLHDDLAPALGLGTRWALTGWPALELVAPHMTSVPSLQVYVAENDFAGPLTEAIGKAGLREVDEGGRVTFWPADDRLLDQSVQVAGLPLVAAPRLYADLEAMGSRGIDAAAHIKREFLTPMFESIRAKVDLTAQAVQH